MFDEQFGEPIRRVVLAEGFPVVFVDETFVEGTEDVAALAAPFVSMNLFEKGCGPLSASAGRERP